LGENVEALFPSVKERKIAKIKRRALGGKRGKTLRSLKEKKS